MYRQTLIVISCIVLTTADDFQDSLKKLWHKDSDSVIDVTSASVVIKPSISSQYVRNPRVPYTYQSYAFRPRAIPIREEPQVERSDLYADVVKNKTDILFPGNYLPIAKEKGSSDDHFQTKAIPLMRSDDYQRRSLEVDEPIIEKPEGFSEASASRRSISYILGEDEDDELGDELEEEDDNEVTREDGVKVKKTKHKKKKLKKYMLPLLLAYKMKYFALVPVMIAGLVLLIGATGLAGFFFALFAAVMGLQKGGY